jgi:hypothetical protein
MSYSIDRSAHTRGPGAIAAYDLREGKGGVVVRTGRGPVVLVRKSALGAAERHQDGGRGRGKPKKKPKLIAKRKPFVATGWTGAARSFGFKAVVKPGYKPGIKPFANAGGLTPTSRPAPARPIGGGGGGGGAAFTPDSAGVSWGPDEFAQASEQEIQEQEDAAAGGGGPAAAEAATSAQPGAPSDETAAQDEAVPVVTAAPVKKPLSTGTKLAVAAGIGYLLFSMWKGH